MSLRYLTQHDIDYIARQIAGYLDDESEVPSTMNLIYKAVLDEMRKGDER